MTQLAEYKIVPPDPARAREVVAFCVAQQSEQFAVARADQSAIAAYGAARRTPAGVEAYRTSMDLWNNDPAFYYRVVEQDAAIQGIMLARRAPEIQGRVSGVNEVRLVAVAEQLRGAGVASELMDEFLYEYANPAAFTQLAVLFANVRARRYFGARWCFNPFSYDVTMNVDGNTSARAMTMSRLPNRALHI